MNKNIIKELKENINECIDTINYLEWIKENHTKKEIKQKDLTIKDINKSIETMNNYRKDFIKQLILYTNSDKLTNILCSGDKFSEKKFNRVINTIIK